MLLDLYKNYINAFIITIVIEFFQINLLFMLARKIPTRLFRMYALLILQMMFMIMKELINVLLHFLLNDFNLYLLL